MVEVLEYINKHLQFFAKSLTKDEDRAMDLIQDTCVMVIRKHHLYSDLPKAVQKKIANTMMRNIFINQHRRKKRIPNIVTDNLYFCESSVTNTGNGIDDKRVYHFVMAHEDERVKAFSLYYQGYKYEEIAKIFNKPLNTIKANIRFGKAKIIKDLRLNKV